MNKTCAERGGRRGTLCPFAICTLGQSHGGRAAREYWMKYALGIQCGDTEYTDDTAAVPFVGRGFEVYYTPIVND